MHYERYESNKTPYIFHLPFTLLQQSAFGIIHALWEILWTFEKYRDTDVDDQRYARRYILYSISDILNSIYLYAN